MVLNDNDRDSLQDILNAAQAIDRFLVGKTLVKYLADEILQGKVKEKIELISVTARRLSPELRAEHPEIPWTEIVAVQEVVEHDYVRAQHEQLWRVATRDIPEVADWIKGIVDSGSQAYDDDGECEFHAAGL
jgi:uncharacterized protein with HEPN domain